MRLFHADGNPNGAAGLAGLRAFDPADHAAYLTYFEKGAEAHQAPVTIGTEDFDLASDLEAAAKFPDDERTIPFTMFTEDPMRTGDIVRVKGYDLRPWGATGMPLLDSHGYVQGHQLGSMAEVTKDKKKKNDVPLVYGNARFSTRPEHTAAAILYGLYRDGHQRAGSIAVRFLEAKLREFDAENPKKDDTSDSYWLPPLDIVRSSALEFSCCSVGRHTEALVRASVGPDEQAAELTQIVVGVVGYNGGKKLAASEAKDLSLRTLAFILASAKRHSETGNFETVAPKTDPESTPKLLTPPVVYATLSQARLEFLMRAIPGRVASDFGLTGGAK